MSKPVASRQRPCYHCNSRPANHGSNFCSQCSHGSRPLFFPTAPKRSKALTALLYTGAAVALVWAATEAIKQVLK